MSFIILDAHLILTYHNFARLFQVTCAPKSNFSSALLFRRKHGEGCSCRLGHSFENSRYSLFSQAFNLALKILHNSPISINFFTHHNFCILLVNYYLVLFQVLANSTTGYCSFVVGPTPAMPLKFSAYPFYCRLPNVT